MRRRKIRPNLPTPRNLISGARSVNLFFESSSAMPVVSRNNLRDKPFRFCSRGVLKAQSEGNNVHTRWDEKDRSLLNRTLDFSYQNGTSETVHRLKPASGLERGPRGRGYISRKSGR